MHYGDYLAVECALVAHSFLQCIVGLNECTRERPLWFRTPLKMAVPSNSALFEGIGGDFGYSPCPKLHLNGLVRPKRKILSLFTYPQVVPNLYDCLCSTEHKGRYSEECGKQSSSGAPMTSIVFFFPMEVNGAPKQPGYKLSSKYLPLFSAEQRNSYRFGTT